MPIHDWKSVEAGTFHAFHTAWITHLSEALNQGILPSTYYALPEQHAGRLIADVLTLQNPNYDKSSPNDELGGVSIAEAIPQVKHILTASPTARSSRRTLTIRHVSGHRVVALGEIISPANKDRRSHVQEFVDKLEGAILNGIHVLLIDLFPPGENDPQGIHAMIWNQFDEVPYELPSDDPLTLASYVARQNPEAFVEHMTFGVKMIDMPLFLTPDRYVNVPLEKTYMMAFQGLPGVWRDVLENGIG